MSMIESLDRRLLLHYMGPNKDPKPADASIEGSVEFNDLVMLAQNYNGTGTTWTQGDFNNDGGVGFSDLVPLAQQYNSSSSYYSDFGADWSLAQSLAGPPETPTFATLNSKGKLIIDLGPGNDAQLSVTSSGKTKVVIGSRSTTGAGSPVQQFSQTFGGVKSIDVTATFGPDSITLGDGLRYTTVRTLTGADTVRGGEGDSAIYGGEGDDQLSGGGGNDSLYGEAGHDRLDDTTGDDFLNGGLGKDRLDGGRGRNTLIGGSGTDYLTLRPTDVNEDFDERDKLKQSLK